VYRFVLKYMFTELDTVGTLGSALSMQIVNLIVCLLIMYWVILSVLLGFAIRQLMLGDRQRVLDEDTNGIGLLLVEESSEAVAADSIDDDDDDDDQDQETETPCTGVFIESSPSPTATPAVPMMRDMVDHMLGYSGGDESGGYHSLSCGDDDGTESESDTTDTGNTATSDFIGNDAADSTVVNLSQRQGVVLDRTFE